MLKAHNKRFKMDWCKHHSYRRNVHTSHLSERYVSKLPMKSRHLLNLD